MLFKIPCIAIYGLNWLFSLTNIFSLIDRCPGISTKLFGKEGEFLRDIYTKPRRILLF